MALTDEATLVIGNARFYTAVTGTAAPEDLDAPGSPWVEIGHTSIDNVMGMESEGGEVTTLGTLQKRQLRNVRASRTDKFRVDLQQFDEDGLKLFYGSNAAVVGGMIQVPDEPLPTTCAFLMVAFDGENEFAVHAPKAEIFRADNMELGDTESLATLPLEVTPLADGTNKWTYQLSALSGS